MQFKDFFVNKKKIILIVVGLIVVLFILLFFFGWEFLYSQFPVQNQEELIEIASNHIKTEFPGEYVIGSPTVNRQIGKKIIVENKTDILEFLVVEVGRWDKQTVICPIQTDRPVTCSPYSPKDTWFKEKLPDAKVTEEKLEVLSVDFDIENGIKMGPNPSTLSVYLNKDKKPFLTALHDILYVD